MAHVKDVETRKFGTQLQNIKGLHERLHVNRVDLAKELEKDKHDRKKPSETRTRREEFGDFEDLLTFRRPNPCFILTLDATFVSCHLFDVFSQQPQIKSAFTKLFFVLCASLSISLISPQTLGPNRG